MANVCCYCRGSRVMRHSRPDVIDEATWAKYVRFGACGLCSGTGQQPTFRMGKKTIPIPVMCVPGKDPGKVWSPCPVYTCREWVDVSNWFHAPKGGLAETSVIARCSQGHGVRLNITLDGLRKDTA